MRTLLVALALLCTPLPAQRVGLTVLATTDLHGNIYPVDYFTGRPANRGLAKIATLVRQARAASPDTLLIDCGDTIQGTPLEYVYQTWVRTGHAPLHLSFAGDPFRADPMMLAMNSMAYDAMVLGNHEFNFGLKNLDRARADARFPWLSANTRPAPGTSAKPFDRYLLKTVAGVRVAVIGITTPAIPSWEKPENYNAYRFEPGKQAVEETLAELRSLPASRRPDLILVAAHAGLGRDLKSGMPHTEDVPGENMVYDIAMGVPGIDAIVFGHTHQERGHVMLNGVLLAQPRNWGMSLARLDFTLEPKPGGGFTVTGKSSRVIPVTDSTAPEDEILRVARPYHEMTERYLNTEIAKSDANLDARLGRVESTALVDALQAVQLYYAQADVSFTALFNTRAHVTKGPVTARQIASLYVYENDLYAIEGTGQMVKDALENAARYYFSCSEPSCEHGSLINPHFAAFNFDMAQGVDYEIDLTQPVGRRIRDLRWKGRPLAPYQKLRIALNNYRAAGAAGYTMFRNGRILWRSSQDIRQLIIDYFTEHKHLPAKAAGNWRILPPEAHAALARQALAAGESIQ